MIYFVLLTIAFVALVIGSYTDIKTREVPDWLNYSLIFLGLGLRLVYSSITSEWSFLLWGVLGFAVFFVIAMLMYYAGQWGGGDSKMLMGLGALIGLGLDFEHMPLLVIFFVNLLLAGAVYGLLWSLFLAIRNWKKFVKEFKKSDLKMIRRVVFIIVLLVLILALFAETVSLKISLVFLAFIVLSSYYVFIFAKAVEKSCMYRNVKPSELTEGDWIAKDVKVKGKFICGPKDLGISKKQIELLRRKKVKKILVKDGIPFVPSFFIAYLMSLLLGNWIRFFFFIY